MKLTYDELNNLFGKSQILLLGYKTINGLNLMCTNDELQQLLGSDKPEKYILKMWSQTFGNIFSRQTYDYRFNKEFLEYIKNA